MNMGKGQKGHGNHHMIIRKVWEDKVENSEQREKERRMTPNTQRKYRH